MANTIDKKYNYSIIVNHGISSRFGCSRRCSYCNWQRLKGFDTSLPDITNEIFDKAKGYITISGGGDPLWSSNNASVFDYIPFVVDQIVAKGFKPRIITREVANFKRIKEETGVNIYLSLSYDTIVEQEVLCSNILKTFLNKMAKSGMMEMTIVSEPWLNLESLAFYIREMGKMMRQIGATFPITIRENLRSVKYLRKDLVHATLEKIKELSKVDTEIRWLPAKVCLDDNIYIFSPQECFNGRSKLFGNSITPNYVEVFNIASNNQHYAVFGSVAKYIALYQNYQERGIQLEDLPEYNDLDVFVEEKFFNTFKDKLHLLGFNKCKRVSEHKFRIWHPLDVAFGIDVNIVENIEIAKVIISEALYNINRVCIINGKIITFEGFSYGDLMDRVARALPHRWDYLNFARRAKSEQRALNKLESKGYMIVKMTFTGKIKQAYYKLQAHVKRFIQRRKHKRE